jgi:hypothetical protein
MKQFLVTSLFLLFAAAPAAAQHHHNGKDDSMRPRIHLIAVGGFLGDANTSLDGVERSDALEPTWGGAAGFEMPIVEFFSFNGEIGLQSWNLDDAENLGLDRNLFLDFTIEPRVRVPVEAGQSHIAFYLGVPLGFTVDFLDDNYAGAFRTVGGDIDTGYGFHLGWRLGAQFFIVRNFGIMADVGSLWRTIVHPVSAGGSDDEIELQTHQLMARVGVSLAL